jgi:outer membrane protein assembly factor BamD (BamD/ComL family)
MKTLLKTLTIIISLMFSLTSYSGNASTEKNTLEQQMHEHNKVMKAFNFAMEQETITAIQDFISLHPTSPFNELAKSTIERLQYEESADKNTVEAYNLYLVEHPESKYSEKATYKRAALINTIEEYDSYLTKYPKGGWRKNTLYKKSRLVNTVEAYNIILSSIYPNDSTVIYYRDKAALDAAKEINTTEAFIDFIEKYPTSSWLNTVEYESNNRDTQHN